MAGTLRDCIYGQAVADALGVLAGAWSGRYLVPFVARYLPAFLFDKPRKM